MGGGISKKAEISSVIYSNICYNFRILDLIKVTSSWCEIHQIFEYTNGTFNFLISLKNLEKIRVVSQKNVNTNCIYISEKTGKTFIYISNEVLYTPITICKSCNMFGIGKYMILIIDYENFFRVLETNVELKNLISEYIEQYNNILSLELFDQKNKLTIDDKTKILYAYLKIVSNHILKNEIITTAHAIEETNDLNSMLLLHTLSYNNNVTIHSNPFTGFIY